MKTDKIHSLADFSEVRQQLQNEIDLAQKQLLLDTERLKYELMPSNMFRSVVERLYNRLLEFVDARLK